MKSKSHKPMMKAYGKGNPSMMKAKRPASMPMKMAGKKPKGGRA